MDIMYLLKWKWNNVIHRPYGIEPLGLFVGEGAAGGELGVDAVDEAALPVGEIGFAPLAVVDHLHVVFVGGGLWVMVNAPAMLPGCRSRQPRKCSMHPCKE